MMQCANLRPYLDRRLGPEDQTAFEQHLTACDACQQEVELFSSLRKDAVSWAESLQVARPSVAQRHALVNGPHQDRSRRWAWGGRSLIAAAAVAAVCIAVWAAIPAMMQREEDSSSLASRTAPTVAELSLLADDGSAYDARPAVGASLSAPKKGHLVASLAVRDRIGVAAGSRVKVLRVDSTSTQLSLRQGSAAFAVAERGKGERFEVSAGEFTVRVIGTRFSVGLVGQAALTVAVTAGKVEVSGTSGSQTVGAGERLDIRGGLRRVSALTSKDRREVGRLLVPGAPVADPAPSRPPPTRRVPRKQEEEPSADMATWQKWIVAGQYEEAATALRQYLENQSRDAAAWLLLADCQRKQRAWKQAVQSYRRGIEFGTVVQANDARFMAASLLQDEIGDASSAARLLRSYLRQPRRLRPLEAMATLRLARAELSLGEVERPKKRLQGIVRGFGGSAEAEQAQRLLDQSSPGGQQRQP